MLQTDRKTETTRETAQDRASVQRRRERTQQSNAALALEAILSGGNWDQLPADGVLALSHTMGNGALADLYQMRTAGPETQPYTLPVRSLETAPMDQQGGMPMLTEAPQFGAMAPMTESAPLQM